MRSSLVALVVVFMATAARAELPRPVARAFLDAGVPLSHVAVVVQRVDARRPLVAHQPDAPMNPASTMKLVTTFAALELLGPDYRWRTEAHLGGDLVEGTLHGDLILKGHGDPRIPPPATIDGAREAVHRWLARRKLAIPGFQVDNGSGLSRTERVTARGLAQLLAAAHASPVHEELAASLAIVATDGTLERRIRNGSAAGRALLKTGSLEGVRTLAGYLQDAGETRWILVALVNHPNAARAQGALDFLADWTLRNVASHTQARH